MSEPNERLREALEKLMVHIQRQDCHHYNCAWLEQARAALASQEPRARCKWCAEGNSRVVSSIDPTGQQFVHHTDVGRVLCAVPGPLGQEPPAAPATRPQLLEEVAKHAQAFLAAINDDENVSTDTEIEIEEKLSEALAALAADESTPTVGPRETRDAKL
jgi:hypothetical protein